jgi:hypothetical protein
LHLCFGRGPLDTGFVEGGDLAEGFGGVNLYPLSQDKDGIAYLDFLLKEDDNGLYPTLHTNGRVTDVQAVS